MKYFAILILLSACVPHHTQVAQRPVPQVSHAPKTKPVVWPKTVVSVSAGTEIIPGPDCYEKRPRISVCTWPTMTPNVVKDGIRYVYGYDANGACSYLPDPYYKRIYYTNKRWFYCSR